jgi:hypothetical protein
MTATGIHLLDLAIGLLGPADARLCELADAAAGRAPYPVPQSEMIANIAALEAIVRSTASGKVETV